MDILNVKQPEIFESVFHKYYASLCYFANKFVRDDVFRWKRMFSIRKISSFYRIHLFREEIVKSVP
ncbi:MAG: hypothetical protein ACLUPL_09455 [Butyricimonas virosa]